MKEVNQQKNSEYNTLSIIGFIFAFLFPPVGFILGIIALSHIKRTNEKGKGLAIAAIVLGALFFVFLILMILIGISWVVIRNTVQGGNEQIDINAMCAQTKVLVTEIIKNTPTNFTVTLLRDVGGEDEIGGVKLVLIDTDVNQQYIQDVPGNIEILENKIVSVILLEGVLVENPNKVGVVVYFFDDSGNEQICPTENSLEF